MMNRPFVQTYECYSVSMLPGNERHDVEKGGKIIMPPSALEQVQNNRPVVKIWNESHLNALFLLSS